MRLISHPDVDAELQEAARFYDKERPGLGAEFLDAIARGRDAMAEHPGRHGLIDEDIRCCLVKRFPYGIIFRQEGDVIRILAVKHHSRHPDYWKYRKESD